MVDSSLVPEIPVIGEGKAIYDMMFPDNDSRRSDMIIPLIPESFEELVRSFFADPWDKFVEEVDEYFEISDILENIRP